MLAGLHNTEDPLALKASVAYVQDLATSDVVFAKNSNAVLPIASITKLMTALVVMDAHLPLDDVLEVSEADVDTEKGSHSRLKVGTRLSRADLLHIALMASENRAAHALGRTYPGGLSVFVNAMNAKARLLGMQSTRFVDPTGLNSANVSSAGDLAKLVTAAYQHDLIRQYSTDTEYWVAAVDGQALRYRNTNALVMNADWQIDVSKTGYISEAGRCLVMQTRIQDRPFVIVLLDSLGKHTRIEDAGRIKKWLEDALRKFAS
jgi:D-alanyl-D-alanine endopeptidase (penicillin-binding protein 7)